LFNEPIVSKGAGGLVLVRDIDFAAISDELLLPFHGRVHIAYIPSNGIVLGLSKLARLTKLCAKQIQSQQSLAQQLVHVLQEHLRPKGVTVIIAAKHLTFSAPQPSLQLTATVSGPFAAADQHMLEDVLAMLDLDVADVHIHYSTGGSHLSHSDGHTLGAFRHASYPSILRGISASSGLDSPPLAPITPDPSEDSDTDRRLQEAADLCEQLSSCSDLEIDSMEAAMQVLLRETGVDGASAAMQSSIRRYVMSLFASTSGYHREVIADYKKGLITAEYDSSGSSSWVGGASHSSSCSCCNSVGVPDGSWQSDQQGQLLGQAVAGSAAAATNCSSTSSRHWHEHHVPFVSQCEHHMLPFYGSIHIAYILNSSSSSSTGSNACEFLDQQEQQHQQQQQQPLTDEEAEQLTGMYTARLQVQERITQQVADAVQQRLNPLGCMVVVQAAHMCMVARGVENHAGSTTTRVIAGAFVKQAQLRSRFLRTVARLAK
jgi:GTP cyclohydrolase I